MAEQPGTSLLSYIRSCLEAACGELAKRLGREIATSVVLGEERAVDQWAGRLSGRALLATGSFSGQVEGQVCFAAGVAEALKMAKALGQDAPAEDQAELREADSAAVVFFLARLGAKASELALPSFGVSLNWPSDPASLNAQVVDLSEGPEPLAAALGGEECWGFELGVGEPFDARLHLLIPAAVAAALDHALAGAGRAADLARILPVAIPVRVVVGRRVMALRDVLRLVPGETLELARRADEPLELEAGGKPVAQGTVVEADGRLALRVVSVTSAPPRLR